MKTTIKIRQYTNGYGLEIDDPWGPSYPQSEIQEERLEILKSLLGWVAKEIGVENQKRRAGAGETC